MSEIIFQGTSDLTLDDKGRITVPARHRDALTDPAGIAGHLTITKHPNGCLMVFPRHVWLDFRGKLTLLSAAAEGWRRIFVGSAVDLDIDAAQRVLVPPELRTWAALDKKLRLVGMGSRFELWDAARYDEQEARVMAAPMPDALQSMVY